MSTIICIEYKYFSEYDAETQQRIIDRNRDFNVSDSFWYESIIESIKDAGALMGIDCDDVYFRLNYSQGDYCQLNAAYRYKPQSVRTIRDEFPKWHEIHAIAEELQRIQARTFYTATVTIEARDFGGMYYDVSIERGDQSVESDLRGAIDSFCHEAYRLIQKEHEYQTSDEALREYFNNSDYEFNDDGDFL